MNYIGKIVLFLILTPGFSSSAMELADQATIVTEGTRLLNNQHSDNQEIFITQFSAFEQMPLVPQDIWRKIIYKWTPISDSDITLQWNIYSAYSLALTCKGLYWFINSLETYSIVRYTVLFRNTLRNFINERGPAPEGTPTTIKEMKALKVRHNGIEKRNLNQVMRLRGGVSELDSLSELHILEDLKPIREGINSTLSPSIQSVLGYAVENREGCTRDEVIVDLTDLSNISGIPLPPYEYDAQRDYKRIFRNKCLLIGGTLLMGSIFVYEGLVLYNQYPQAEANAASAAMLNQTSMDIDYDYWNWWGSSINCYEKYSISRFPWGIWWDSEVYFPDGRRPGYCYFPHMGVSATCSPGNITEWVDQVATWTGFNNIYWLEQVLSIMNGAKHDTRIALCTPNADGTSISCGSAYNRHSQHYWNVDGDIALQLTRGDAVCAHDLVIQGWRTIMGLYWGFGAIGSLLFVWLWLVHFLC